MPVQATKRAAKRAGRRISAAAAAVRGHWSQQEADRRRDLADQMQHRLVVALGLVPAKVQQPR